MEATYQAKMQEIKHTLINNIEDSRARLHDSRGQVHADVAKTRMQLSAQLDGLIADLYKTQGQLHNERELNLRNAGMDTLRLLAQLAQLHEGMDLEQEKLVQELLSRMDAMREAAVSKRLELRRMQVVAAFELAGFKADLSVKHARWAMDNWQYFGNLMAAPGGGTALPGDRMPSKMTSALGGGLSGAAAGAQMGGGWGALAGGILGAGAAIVS